MSPPAMIVFEKSRPGRKSSSSSRRMKSRPSASAMATRRRDRVIPLLPHVLPHARLALGQPLERGQEALLAGGVRLRLRDPVHVLAAMAGGELLEGGARLRVLLER